MNLQQIRYLCAVADNQLNISNAAEQLHTSQPGISKQLRLLEAELGVDLFVRNGRNLTALSAAGKSILGHARLILQQTEAMRQTAADATDDTRGSLSIATTHTQSRYLLPAVISRFVQQYPQVSLHMQQGTPMQIAELASRGEADFAIATEAIATFENLVMMPCFRWNRVLLVPEDHPLTKCKKLTLKDIAAYPLVTYVQGFTGRDKLDQAFHSQGLQPNIVFTASDADVIKTYVRLGLGIGIIASMAVEADRDPDLRALDVSHLFDWSTTSIGFRRESYLRGYMLDFIQMFAPHLSHDCISRFVNADSSNYEQLISSIEVPEFSL